MAFTETEIGNFALGHLGTGKEIASFTEKSEEASAIRRFYNICRDKSQRDYAWPFTRKIEALQLVEERPNDEWYYSYRYPSQCLDFKKIQSGIRNDSRQSRVSYVIAHDDAGLLIYTDQEFAKGEYTRLIKNTALFPPDYVLALSALLALMIAPSITKGDPFNFRQTMSQLYRQLISEARVNAANEGQPDENPEAELVRVRY